MWLILCIWKHLSARKEEGRPVVLQRALQKQTWNLRKCGVSGRHVTQSICSSPFGGFFRTWNNCQLFFSYFFPLGIFSQGGKKEKTSMMQLVMDNKALKPRRALQQSDPLSNLPLMGPYSGQPHGLKLYLVSYTTNKNQISLLSPFFELSGLSPSLYAKVRVKTEEEKDLSVAEIHAEIQSLFMGMFLQREKGESWRRRVSIPVPLACKASALPFELHPLSCKDGYEVLLFTESLCVCQWWTANSIWNAFGSLLESSSFPTLTDAAFACCKPGFFFFFFFFFSLAPL